MHSSMVTRRLLRSKRDRILGGVCGGIGVYLDADPTLIRLIWAVLAVVSFGTALIAYVLAWLIIPEERDRPVRAG